MYIPLHELDISDNDIFNALDRTSPALEPVLRAYDSGDAESARKLLVKQKKKREKPRFLYDYRSLPVQQIDTDSNIFLFQAALGLADGSLKEFCLYAADKLMDNIYVQPGRGRGEHDLGKNYENMLHFNFLTDLGKKHRNPLDMMVRGQIFEYLAVAYHETGERKYVDKFAEFLRVFMRTYPLDIADTSAGANRFMFEEDRDVMSVGWLIFSYTTVLYTRLGYEIPADLAFEVIKRIWFLGIQFNRFLTDSYRPFNHHLWERGLVPYCTAVLYPEFPELQRGKEKGKEVIIRHTKEDFNNDGGYSEHSIGYWAGAALGEMTCRGLSIARRNGEELLDPETMKRVMKSFSLLATLSPPGERYPSVGDNNGPLVNHILAQGAASTGEESCKELLAYRRGMPYHREKLPVKFYANDTTGFSIMRSGFDINADYILMSVKTNCGSSGHNHMDMLSLCVTLNGKELIGEPYAGKLYHKVTMKSPQRGRLYNMTGHNTVLCYGIPVQEDRMYADKWGVLRPDTPVLSSYCNETLQYVKACSRAYTCCNHIREVSYAVHRGLLVRDIIEHGNRTPDAHIQRWHLMDGCKVYSRTDKTVLLEKDGLFFLMIWDAAESIEVYTDKEMYGDSSFPVIDVRFRAPEAENADTAGAYLTMAMLNVPCVPYDDQIESTVQILSTSADFRNYRKIEDGEDIQDLDAQTIMDNLHQILK